MEEFFAQLDLEVLIAEHDGLAFVRKRRRAEGRRTRWPCREPLLDTLFGTLHPCCVFFLSSVCTSSRAQAGSKRALCWIVRQSWRCWSPLLPTQANEARQSDAVDAQINNLLRYGFLRRLNGDEDRLEVTRLLKYKIDADTIAEMRQKLLAQGAVDES